MCPARRCWLLHCFIFALFGTRHGDRTPDRTRVSVCELITHDTLITLTTAAPRTGVSRHVLRSTGLLTAPVRRTVRRRLLHEDTTLAP